MVARGGLGPGRLRLRERTAELLQIGPEPAQMLFVAESAAAFEQEGQKLGGFLEAATSLKALFVPFAGVNHLLVKATSGELDEYTALPLQAGHATSASSDRRRAPAGSTATPGATFPSASTGCPSSRS